MKFSWFSFEKGNTSKVQVRHVLQYELRAIINENQLIVCYSKASQHCGLNIDMEKEKKKT